MEVIENNIKSVRERFSRERINILINKNGHEIIDKDQVQANFKDCMRFGTFKGLVEQKNVVLNSFMCKLGSLAGYTRTLMS
jgi:hypothetical protein